MRGKAGCKGGQLFRSLDNPNDILILFEWDTKERATKFVESEDLKKTMQKAGVSGKPEIHFFEKIEDFPV
jgi:heme-degrading monooxygenase HmoA